MMEDSSVRVHSKHLPYGFAYRNHCGSGHVTTASDIFFVEEELTSSGELGIKKDNKASDSHQPVNPPTLHAIFGRRSKYSF